MKIIDITQKLDENTTVYQGDPRFVMETFRSIEKDNFMLSKLRMGTHTGTHVDAPCHFMRGGKTISEIPLKVFVGDCVVVNDLSEFNGGAERVLIKGGQRLNEADAQKLVDLRVCLIGTGNLSIGGDAVHKILLGHGCMILESLDLKKTEPGKYLLSAAPLKIDGDGSPVRACLIVKDE